MPDTIYDIAVIGSGPAGYTAAIRAGQYGLKTALIEKDPYLGGTCLHVGCIPTKALLFNAELWDHLKDAKEYGIEGVNSRKLNWQAVQERKTKIVDKHAKGLQFLMRKNKVETIKGTGKLTGPAQNGVHTIEVKDGSKGNQIKTKNVLLATGSEARMIPGLEPNDRVLTNIEILNMGAVPKSLVVVGAGAVGVEFASIFRSFDCEVTIIEMLPRMVPLEDEEVSKELARVYRKRGINFHGGAKVDKVEKTKSGIAVTFTADGKQQKLEAEKILIAIGRKPNTDGIGLEKTRIQTERGFVKTNEWMQTAEPGIYAIGDIVLGTPQLAHVGGMEGIVAVSKIADKEDRPINPLRIPNVTFCHPEIGSVGLTEAKAREQGYNVKIGKFPFTANSRASIVGEHEGFIKVVSDAKYGEILGVHIIGPQATELIAEAVTAMELEATVEDLMWTIHAHPTLAEAMLDASNSVYGLAINM
ncbi:MAG: dihydrolipoyl dehydrogenase [Acidobacteria bacterium 13_1_20CM_4_56_7]|nr:MAG: dihydrolipoyl dehydrogenase [Acidobacteria bacterium 13_1_20CM_4_56_7]